MTTVVTVSRLSARVGGRSEGEGGGVEEEISGVKWKTRREGWNVEGGVECVRVL